MTSCLNFPAASAHSCTIHSCSYKPADIGESCRSSRSSHGGDANCADATLLRHPIPGAKLSLWTDASDKAVGGCLCNFARTIGNLLPFVSETLEKSAEMVHI
ncbi:hypothetical protein TNCV_64401 [Trichonephila clavipes]|nr:hypothetical protein TNCV_64401 [Trichonephila clavipes]